MHESCDTLNGLWKAKLSKLCSRLQDCDWESSLRLEQRVPCSSVTQSNKRHLCCFLSLWTETAPRVSHARVTNKSEVLTFKSLVTVGKPSKSSRMKFQWSPPVCTFYRTRWKGMRGAFHERCGRIWFSFLLMIDLNLWLRCPPILHVESKIKRPGPCGLH